MTTVAETSANTGLNTTRAPQWQPGESGNPSGRPKGFGAIIRERTNNGEDAVKLALQIMAGETIDGEKPNLKLRFQAMEWVVDRGWGKSVAVIEHTGAIKHDLHVFDGVATETLRLIVAAKAIIDAESEDVVEGEMHELEAHDDEG